MTTARILSELDRLGERLMIEGENLVLIPGRVPPEVVAAIRERKGELLELLRLKEAGKIARGSDLLALKRYLPAYGKRVETRGGWSGTVWGASPRGLLLDTGPGLPIVAVDFSDVVETSNNRRE